MSEETKARIKLRIEHLKEGGKCVSTVNFTTSEIDIKIGDTIEYAQGCPIFGDPIPVKLNQSKVIFYLFTSLVHFTPYVEKQDEIDPLDFLFE